MVWDDEIIRNLRELWAQGLSTAEIGRRLGVSKNAIVGKAHRLELDARPSPIRRDAMRPAAQRSATLARVAGPTLPPLASAAVRPVAALPANVRPLHASPTVSQPSSLGRPAPTGGAPAGMTSSGLNPTGGAPADSTQAGLSQAGLSQAGLSQAGLTQAGLTQAGLTQAGLTQVGMGSPGMMPTITVVPRPMQTAPMHARRSAPTCCWPIGEPGTKSFRFCDDASLAGKPYCDEHAKLAYVRVRDRKEDAA